MFFLRRDLGEVFSLFSRWKPCFKFGMLLRKGDLIFFPLSKLLIVSRRKRKLPGRSIEYFVVACRVGCTCFDPGDQKNALNLKRQPEEKEEYFIFLQTLEETLERCSDEHLDSNRVNWFFVLNKFKNVIGTLKGTSTLTTE